MPDERPAQVSRAFHVVSALLLAMGIATLALLIAGLWALGIAAGIVTAAGQFGLARWVRRMRSR